MEHWCAIGTFRTVKGQVQEPPIGTVSPLSHYLFYNYSKRCKGLVMFWLPVAFLTPPMSIGQLGNSLWWLQRLLAFHRASNPTFTTFYLPLARHAETGTGHDSQGLSMGFLFYLPSSMSRSFFRGLSGRASITTCTFRRSVCCR